MAEQQKHKTVDRKVSFSIYNIFYCSSDKLNDLKFLVNLFIYIYFLSYSQTVELQRVRTQLEEKEKNIATLKEENNRLKIEQQKVQEEIHRVKREKAETRMTQLTTVRITSGYTHTNTHTLHIDPHTYIPHTSQAYATHTHLLPVCYF